MLPTTIAVTHLQEAITYGMVQEGYLLRFCTMDVMLTNQTKYYLLKQADARSDLKQFLPSQKIRHVPVEKG